MVLQLYFYSWYKRETVCAIVIIKEEAVMAGSHSSANVGNLGLFSAGAVAPADLTEIRISNDYDEIAKQRNHFIRYQLTTASAYYDELLDTNPAFFPYMSIEQREAMRRDLKLAEQHLSSQRAFYEMEGRSVDKNKINKRITICNQLHADIITVNSITLVNARDFQRGVVDTKESERLNAIKKTLSKQLEDELDILRTAKTVFIREWMNAINAWRMYWVWTGWMVRQLGVYYANTSYLTKGREAAAAVQDAALFVSFALYFVRAAINLSLLVKHVFFPTRAEEEALPTYFERLKAQLDQRGWSLLNDIIWGIGNFITAPHFYYWFQKETMCEGFSNETGFNGLAVTAGLLFMDFMVTICQRISQQKKHEAVITEFNETERVLKQKLLETNNAYILACARLEAQLNDEILPKLQLILKDENDIDINNVDDVQRRYSYEHRKNQRVLLAKQKALQVELNKLPEKTPAITDYLDACKEREILLASQEHFDKRRRHYDLLWEYKRQTLNANIAFAASLVAAVVVVSDFFVSKDFDWGISSALGANEFMLLGPIFLYAFSLINNIYRGYLEISKTYAQIDLIDKDLDSMGSDFAEHETDLDKIQRKQLAEDKNYHRQMINYHIINTIRKALVEVLLPAVLIIGCGTLTMGAGFGLMAGVAVLSFVTRVLLDALMKPKRNLVKAEDVNGLSSYPVMPSLPQPERTDDSLSSVGSDVPGYFGAGTYIPGGA